MFRGDSCTCARSAIFKSLLAIALATSALAAGAAAQTAGDTRPASSTAATKNAPSVGGELSAASSGSTDQGTESGGPQPAAQNSAPGYSTVGAAIVANLGQPDQICAACTPLILANPAVAADLIDAAKDYPELSEKLAQCLSKIQQSMRASNPEGAETINALVATAPPGFQAAYAIALVPDSSGDAGAQAAAAPDGGAAGDGGGGSGDAGGGGTVSPSTP